jgi:hypothetical protein
MKTKKKISWLLVPCAAVCATSAFAIPVAFDFSGTVRDHQFIDFALGGITSDPTAAGQDFTARMVFETDLFTQRVAADRPNSRTLDISTEVTNPPPWDVTLIIGGNAVNLALYDSNYGLVHLADSRGPLPSCAPAGCASGDNDVLAIAARSEQSGPLGLEASRLLTMVGFEGVVPFGGSPAYIDLDQPFDIASLLTVELPNLALTLSDNTFNCTTPTACSTHLSEQTHFNITSMTRSALSVSVPEPSTLGLFAIGLLGAAGARRRRVAA